MQEIVRWPSFVGTHHVTGMVEGGNVGYLSTRAPGGISNRYVNCLLMPAEARKILAIRMLIAGRGGASASLIQFRFRVMDAATGSPAGGYFTTSPPTLDLQNTTLLPSMVWTLVHQATSPTTARMVNPGQYLAVIFSVVHAPTSDFRVAPLFELTIDT